MLATVGVLVVVYGGAESQKPAKMQAQTTTFIPSAPLVGDLLTLVASIIYGLYQVLYKKYAALPTETEVLSDPLYDPIFDADPSTSSDEAPTNMVLHTNTANVPPFGLHANLLTSTIGLLTLTLLWLPMPLLHHFDIEKFALPKNTIPVLAISGIALTGVIFNAAFMACLSYTYKLSWK